MPASKLDITHAVVLTGAAFTPASSSSRASTTARMRNPSGEYRKSTNNPSTITIVTAAVAMSSRLRKTCRTGERG